MNCNIRRDVRVCFTKLRLSRQKILAELASDKCDILPSKEQVFFILFDCIYLCVYLYVFFYINNTAKGNTSLMLNKLLLLL